MKTTTATLIASLQATNDTTPHRLSLEINDGERTIYRAFLPQDRYMVDNAPDYHQEGWQQFDTDQDAAHFGVWANPKN